MRIKITGIVNEGSLIQVLGTDEKGNFCSIPFDWRMFQQMWECLDEKQKKGKKFVHISEPY